MIYQFLVEKVWTGVKSDTIEIKTGLGGQDQDGFWTSGKPILYLQKMEKLHCQVECSDWFYEYWFEIDYKFTWIFPKHLRIMKKEIKYQESEYLNRQI